jgi:hypothetical protein
MNAERTIYMACDATDEVSDCRYCQWRGRVAEYLEERKSPDRNPNFRMGRDLAIIEFKTSAAMGEFILQFGEACLTRETCSGLLDHLRVRRKAFNDAEEAEQEKELLEQEQRIRDEENQRAA